MATTLPGDHSASCSAHLPDSDRAGNKAAILAQAAELAAMTATTDQPPRPRQRLHRLTQLANSQGSPVIQTVSPAADGLAALKQAAEQASQRRPRTQPISYQEFHAAPLSPLRERDLEAMNLFFQRDDMIHIEAEVNHLLLRLLPAPCWEDDALEFLREFLAPSGSRGGS